MALRSRHTARDRPLEAAAPSRRRVRQQAIISATKLYTSTPNPAHRWSARTACAAPSKSNNPMTATSAVSLKNATNVLTVAGSVDRSACGREICSVAGQVRQSERRCGFVLTRRDSIQAGAHHLRFVSRHHDREGQDRSYNRVEDKRARHHQGRTTDAMNSSMTSGYGPGELNVTRCRRPALPASPTGVPAPAEWRRGRTA